MLRSTIPPDIPLPADKVFTYNTKKYYFDPEYMMVIPLPEENLKFENEPGLYFKKVDDKGNPVIVSRGDFGIDLAATLMVDYDEDEGLDILNKTDKKDKSTDILGFNDFNNDFTSILGL